MNEDWVAAMQANIDRISRRLGEADGEEDTESHSADKGPEVFQGPMTEAQSAAVIAELRNRFRGGPDRDDVSGDAEVD